MMESGMFWIWLMTGTVMGFYEHSNESLGSLRQNFLLAELLWVFKKALSLWCQFLHKLKTSLFLTASATYDLIFTVFKFFLQCHMLSQCDNWAVGWMTEESVFNSQQRGLPHLQFNWYQGSLLCRQSDHVLKLTAHLHQVLRLRMMVHHLSSTGMSFLCHLQSLSCTHCPQLL